MICRYILGCFHKCHCTYNGIFAYHSMIHDYRIHAHHRVFTNDAAMQNDPMAYMTVFLDNHVGIWVTVCDAIILGIGTCLEHNTPKLSTSTCTRPNTPACSDNNVTNPGGISLDKTAGLHYPYQAIKRKNMSHSTLPYLATIVNTS